MNEDREEEVGRREQSVAAAESRLPMQSSVQSGIRLAAEFGMINKDPNHAAPQGDQSEPLGDLGERGKTWSPAQGEQGISNRIEDEDPEAEEETDPSND